MKYKHQPMTPLTKVKQSEISTFAGNGAAIWRIQKTIQLLCPTGKESRKSTPKNWTATQSTGKSLSHWGIPNPNKFHKILSKSVHKFQIIQLTKIDRLKNITPS